MATVQVAVGSRLGPSTAFGEDERLVIDRLRPQPVRAGACPLGGCLHRRSALLTAKQRVVCTWAHTERRVPRLRARAAAGGQECRILPRRHPPSR